jgi:Uma2 family endonuclease
MPLYAHYGVGHVWLIDPEARTLEAYGLRDGAWVEIGHFSADEQVAVAPFDAVTIDLAGLWA